MFESASPFYEVGTNKSDIYRCVLKIVDDELYEVIKFLIEDRTRDINHHLTALDDLEYEIRQLNKSTEDMKYFVRETIRELRKDFKLEDD